MKKSVSKKLVATRKIVSKRWGHFRVEKKKILSKKRLPLLVKNGLIEDLRKVTKSNISEDYSDYRGFKFGVTHSSPYDNFAFTKEHRFNNTLQKSYKLNSLDNSDKIDSTVGEMLTESKVLGVIVSYRVRDNEDDLIHYGSIFMTSIKYEQMKQNNKSIHELLSEHFEFKKSMQDYELISIHIRVVYENS